MLAPKINSVRRVRGLWRRCGNWQVMHAAHEIGGGIPARPLVLSGPAGQRLHIDRIAGSVRSMTINGSPTGGDDDTLSVGLEAGPFAQYPMAALSDGRFEAHFAVPPQQAGRAFFAIDTGRPEASWTAAAEFDVRNCVAPWRRLIGFYLCLWTAIVPRAFDFFRPARPGSGEMLSCARKWATSLLRLRGIAGIVPGRLNPQGRDDNDHYAGSQVSRLIARRRTASCSAMTHGG